MTANKPDEMVILVIIASVAYVFWFRHLQIQDCEHSGGKMIAGTWGVTCEVQK